MKKFISFLFLLFVSLASSGHTPHRSNQLQVLFEEYSKDMQDEYGMNIIRHSITATPKVTKIVVDFYEYSEVEISQGRFLVHQAAENLLNRINSCKYIRPFLNHYPFTEEDIEISVSSFLNPKTHKNYVCGKLSCATLFQGIIYYSESRLNKEKSKKIHQEKYIPHR